VCGSDLWPNRGAQPTEAPTPMGHEYCGIVEEVGRFNDQSERPSATVTIRVLS
jgi:threonine dehydrogenase-like Zn-dependent dehydrogenase